MNWATKPPHPDERYMYSTLSQSSILSDTRILNAINVLLGTVDLISRKHIGFFPVSASLLFNPNLLLQLLPRWKWVEKS